MKLFIQLIILISINEESKLFYWLIIKTWNYFGHWLIGLIQRPKIILVLSMYSFLIGRSCTRRIVIFDHWFLIQWFTNIHLWFLFLFSLANSYLLLSFPSRTHHHSLSSPHQSANTHHSYTLLLSSYPNGSFSSLTLSPWSFLRSPPPTAFSTKPCPPVWWRRWKRERRRRHEEGRYSGGGTEMTEEEDDAVEMVVVTNQTRRQR